MRRALDAEDVTLMLRLLRADAIIDADADMLMRAYRPSAISAADADISLLMRKRLCDAC